MKKKFLLVLLVISAGAILSQTMVVKKADGSYQEIAVAQLSFYIPCPETPTVDYEGKTYNTVLIGNQCWLKENLNVGTRINSNTEQTNNSTIEKYCYNDDDANCTTYGGLYQWAEAVQYLNGATNTTSPSPAFSGNVHGICPTGWHIPTQTEFQSLGTAVSNNSNTLKAIDQGTGSGIGTNISGFSALLTGYRYIDGSWMALGNYSAFWISQNIGTSETKYMDIYNNSSNISFPYNNKAYGFSVRCLKDPPSAPTVTTTTVNSITSTTASSGGNVTSDGGASVTARGVCWSTSTSPTTADNKTTDGLGTGSFTSSLTGLTVGNTYYVRAYATNSVGTTYGSEVSFTATFVCGDAILYAGQTYNTILIGSQCWLKENLNVGTRINGSADQTNNSTIEKYCYNDDDANCTTYGGLYQWAESVQYLNGATNTASPSPAFSGNVQGICPTGWHIPTIAEFEALGTTVSTNGNSLKATGQGSGDGAGTNTSGLSVLLAGEHNFHYGFRYLDDYVHSWSSTEDSDGSLARFLSLTYYESGIGYPIYEKANGSSVRCLKD